MTVIEPGKPWLIGEAPSRLGDRYYTVPLSGRPAKVLCELAGIPPQEGGTQYGRWTWALYEHFNCRNLIRRYADATPWNARKAHLAADRFLNEIDADQRETVICLGRKVGDAFGLIDYPWGEWESLTVTLNGLTSTNRWCVLPHPSGLNRTLNDPEIRSVMGHTLRTAMSERVA